MKNLRNSIASLLMVLFAMGSTFAQNSSNSLLWKVEGQGIKTSYLFGTFHMLPKKDFVLKDKVLKALEASSLVTMELDMDDPSMQTEMMKYSTLENGDSLQAYMSSDEYNTFDDYFTDAMGVGMEQFKSFKPIVLTSMIMMSYLGDQMASYEGSLIKLAKEQNKEIVGLETVAFQMGIFDVQPYDEQIDDLMKYLTEEGYMKKLFNEMIAHYKAEDISGLYEYMDDYFGEDMALMKRLLDDRNTDWIPKIGEKSKNQKVFYAVGAGHLGGKKGVINQLKEAGYKVTPILD